MLSLYHRRQAALSDEEIEKRANGKKEELKEILKIVQLSSRSEPVRVAVLGCADKRYIAWHKKIFEDVIGKTSEIITFDIAIDHLAGEANVIKHDCTLPLPNGFFDITFGHILLKFIKPEGQFNLLINSYDSLNPGGLAIHIMDADDYTNKQKTEADGLNFVDLGKLKKKLKSNSIEFVEVSLKYGNALVLKK